MRHITECHSKYAKYAVTGSRYDMAVDTVPNVYVRGAVFLDLDVHLENQQDKLPLALCYVCFALI